jgi:hypothetical protein
LHHQWPKVPDHWCLQSVYAVKVKDKGGCLMIRKGKFTENFVTLSNALAQDRTLSLEARGLLAYLLSKPPEWIVRETDLKFEGGCGTYRIRRIIKELIAAKYMIKAKPRANDGTFETVEFEVFPEPQTPGKQSTVQKPTVDNPRADNQPLIKERPLKNTDVRNLGGGSANTPEHKSNLDKKPRQKPASSKGSLIDPDWRPTEADKKHGLDRGYTILQLDDLARHFHDHWQAKSGATAFKRDWSAAWRTWVRNDIKFNGHPNRASGQ